MIPGDTGYSDFWRINKVTVPADYVANAVASLGEIRARGFVIEPTSMVVNCPVVPAGSTAKLRYTKAEASGLQRGWHRGKRVSYFTFAERSLAASAAGEVPDSDIFVTFNLNPDTANAASGPPSGFRTEASSPQTHNVIQTIPEDATYSPLWDVSVYDNAEFTTVMDLGTAMKARLIARGVALVNCPVVAKN